MCRIVENLLAKNWTLLMLIATAQLPMRWNVEDNVAAILATNTYVGRLGVRLVAYPELAVTGYHRDIVKASETFLGDAKYWSSLRESAVANRIYVWVGLPESDSGKLYNSYACIGPDGALLGCVRKNGITDTEGILFAAGVERPVLRNDDLGVSAFLCRESVDLDSIQKQLQGACADLLLWPGYIGNSSFPDPQHPEGTVDQAAAIAERLSTVVVQSNWPNSLNSPDQDDLGGSAIIDSSGLVVGRCPAALPGLGIFDNSSNSFSWDSTAF